MINDMMNGTSHSTGDYLSTWGQNIVGGAELGASFDVAVMSGGTLALAGSGALGGAGTNALTFGGEAKSWSDFGKGQLEGAGWGAAGGVVFGKAMPYLGKAGEWAASKSQTIQKAATAVGNAVEKGVEKVANSEAVVEAKALASKVEDAWSLTKEKVSGLLKPSRAPDVGESVAKKAQQALDDEIASMSRTQQRKSATMTAAYDESRGTYSVGRSVPKGQQIPGRETYNNGAEELGQALDDIGGVGNNYPGCNHLIGNCAEPAAAKPLLQAGSKMEDIKFVPSKRPATGEIIAPCPICQNTFPSLKQPSLGDLISPSAGVLTQSVTNDEE